MLQLDLSTLSGPDLRSLLDTARERGQARQSYLILQEMARRREGGDPGLRKRASRRDRSEPRFIELDLGDPLERLAVEEEEAQPDPIDDLRLEREPDPDPPPRRRWSVGVFTAGAVVGLAVGAFAGSVGEAFLRPSSELAQFRAEVEAAPAPPPAPKETDAPLVAPAELADAPPPAPPVEVAAEYETPAPDAAEAAPQEVADAEPAPEPPPARKELAATAAPKPCPGATTPADRAICGDAELEKLQQDLRRAYAAALSAHADRDILRQRQLAWRDARNDVSDPHRLAALYSERIRKLNAATADARRQQ
ncbi:hypothetical protein [Phenylobacterium sp.]|uniref:hypothetical protein n=1 Tax=Phenylobacterium sp. TaxID=1871053 RepID=UPI0025FC934F|nr:hypothetical protein [Phenylobacterium sp.]MBX3482945.1 hypothetical protein [Phenylobacterium sp.]